MTTQTMENFKLGKYLTLQEFCTCTQTYRKFSDKIKPFPQNVETFQALKELNQFIIDPVIDYFGIDRFHLTYGFCSPDLKKYLEKRDPITGLKNGRITADIDQHLAHEIKMNGQYYCERLGAACDFSIDELGSDRLVDWILKQQLPFDSIYFYGGHRPIHISYGPEHKRDIWGFTPVGKPTKKGLEHWIEAIHKEQELKK